MRYTLRDPLVGGLLDLARRIFNNHLDKRKGCFVSCGERAAEDNARPLIVRAAMPPDCCCHVTVAQLPRLPFG